MYSPAEIDGASPSTVTRSRCPRALTRRTQNPLSVLWKVTRSTKPASASRSLEELDPEVSIRACHKLKGHLQAITLSCNLGCEPTRPAPAPQEARCSSEASLRPSFTDRRPVRLTQRPLRRRPNVLVACYVPAVGSQTVNGDDRALFDAIGSFYVVDLRGIMTADN